MKALYKVLAITISVIGMQLAAMAAEPVEIRNQQASRVEGHVRLSADVVLDSVKLSGSGQFFLTPVVEDERGNSLKLPSLLVNGKAMQIAWERKSFGRSFRDSRNVLEAVRRNNGKPQTVSYITDTEYSAWMWRPDTRVRWVVDNCGCGDLRDSEALLSLPLDLNPLSRIGVAYKTPAVTELPVSIHNGEAAVNFEVNRTELHAGPYRTANGRMIDNSGALKTIDDSLRYALKDKNVELAGISICGYASPEGRYIDNERLATDRSRALAEYVASRHNLPEGVARYDAVAEDWAGFRKIVESAPELNAQHRAELLALIDRPAYGPSDYDAKERELRADARFAALFRDLILPEWFPRLRTTRFEITTRLRPLSDEELAKVIETTPEKMSLNQMFRVARLYPESSDEFYRVMETAARYYPDDPTANINLAAARISRGNYEGAAECLRKAGDTPEAAHNRALLPPEL